MPDRPSLQWPLLVGCLAAALAPLLPAAARQPAPAQRAAPAAAAQERSVRAGPDLRAGKLIGTDVRNPQGERVGDVRDLLVDVTDNKVPYAVIGSGGVLGAGSRVTAVPLQAFAPSAGGQALVYVGDLDKLRSAPVLDLSRWSDLAQGNYTAQVDRHFGMPAAASRAVAPRIVRASKLIGKDIDDLQGKDAGEVNDLVLTLGSGTVHYAVIEFEKAWVPDDKLLALPLYALAQPEDPESDLVLTVQRDRLDLTRAFEDTRWPDLNDPQYQRETSHYLRNLPPPLGGRP